MSLCLLIGGDRDGTFIELPEQRWRDAVLVPNEPTFERRDWDSRHALDVRPTYVHYKYQKIHCPDGWTQEVYVHPGVDPYAITETEIVDIVMRHWRESHRRGLYGVNHDLVPQ